MTLRVTPPKYFHRPASYVALDTETTGLSVHRGDRPFCAAASLNDGRSFFWRWNPVTLQQEPGSDNLEMLSALCLDPHIDKVFHNAKFDIGMLQSMGSPFLVKGQVWDTGILVHLLDGRNAEGKSGLDEATKKYLPNAPAKVVTPIEEFFEATGLKRRDRNFQLLPLDILRARNTGDAHITRLLFERLFVTVATTFPYLLDLEHRLIPIVARAENRGIAVNLEEAGLQIEYLQTVVSDVTDFACAMLDWSAWNMNSPVHQRELLIKANIYDQLGEWTKPNKKRKTAKPFVPQRKVDTAGLIGLHHPVAHMMLVGKAAQKMISPFLENVMDLSVNGVIHPNYKQTGTVSGRFSCTEPNLQNIPVEGERKAQYTEAEADEILESTGYNLGQHIKRVFVTRPGYVHIHADKKQAEMYALGHYSEDEALIEILGSGQSVHDAMCLRMFGEITKGLKQRSKAVTFGYQYGAGLGTLARKIKGTIIEAKGYRDRLARLYRRLPQWRALLEQQITERGYVLTDSGRRHYLRPSEAYIAVNRVCQGHVGDELKGRMVAIGEALETAGYDARIILNIHDELAVECAADQAEEVGPLVYRKMLESDIEHKVPIPSDVEITSTRWADLTLITNPYEPSAYRTLSAQTT